MASKYRLWLITQSPRATLSLLSIQGNRKNINKYFKGERNNAFDSLEYGIKKEHVPTSKRLIFNNFTAYLWQSVIANGGD